MVNLQSGQRYVRVLAELVKTLKQSDRLGVYKSNFMRNTYSFPIHCKVCSVVSQPLHHSSLSFTQYLPEPWLGQASLNLRPFEQQCLAQLPASQEHHVKDNNACCCHCNEPLQCAVVSCLFAIAAMCIDSSCNIAVECLL